MSINLNSSGVVAVVGLAASVITVVWAWPKIKALIPKVNPADRENLIYQSTGEIGLKIPDWFGGLFKSQAEKDVDKMLQQTRPESQAAPSPTVKSVVTPADAPAFKPGSYYDLGQKPLPWYTPTRYYDLGATGGTTAKPEQAPYDYSSY